MKKFLVCCVVFLISSCGDSFEEKREKAGATVIFSGTIEVIAVDSCEYVIWAGNYNGGIVHKQNCKNCSNK